MKTSAISNPVNLNSGSASSTKLSDTSSDAPFSQMLSREMTARTQASEPAPKTSAAQDSKESKATSPESKTDNSKSAEHDASNAPESTSGTATTDKSADKPAVSDTAKDKKSDTDQEDEATVSAASADLLALVANLTQPAGQASVNTDAAEDGEQTALNATDDGGKSRGKSHSAAQMTAQDQNALLEPQTAAQDQNALPMTQTTKSDQNALLAAQPAVSADNLPVSVQITSQLHSDVGTAQAPDKASRLSAANAVRRAIGTGTGTNARATAANNDIAPEPKEFDAKLAQAKDDRPAPAHLDGEKPQPSLSELAMKQSSERPALKTVQDIQQPAVAPLNVGTLSATQTQPTPQMVAQAADMLSPRVGTQGWDQALGQKVVWMVGSEQQSASLTLNPPDLGPLQVVLHVSENQATANFTAAQPEVRHALEAAMPKLREMLGDAGIQLSQANVSAGMPNNQQSAFGQPQQSSRNTGAASESSDTPTVRVSRSQTITGGAEGLCCSFVDLSPC